MLRIATGAATAVLLMSSSAFAWDPPKPPAPAAPTYNNENYNKASANAAAIAAAAASARSKSIAGAAAFGGPSSATGGASTASGVGGGATINQSAPGTTYAHIYQDGNPWANPAASAVAPAVYAASICQAGVSGAAQTPLFGISFGSVQGLDVCIQMMLAEQARTYGRLDMATYFLCQAKEWRGAYKATGTPCPQDAPAGSPAPVLVSSKPVPVAGETRAQCYARLNASQTLTSDNARLCSQLGS